MAHSTFSFHDTIMFQKFSFSLLFLFQLNTTYSQPFILIIKLFPMRLTILLATLIGLVLTGCEKIPPTENPQIKFKIYDLQGKPAIDLFAGLQIKIVSEEFKKFAQQQIDKKEIVVIFDQIIAPSDSIGPDFIITRVPLMNHIQPLFLTISIRIRTQLIPLCNVCIPYRPTVSGRILTGFSGGASDGTFTLPAEMSADAAGNLYVIDQRSPNDVVLRVTPTGEVSTFAGASAEFGKLVGIGINNTTNKMYLADATAQRVFELNMTSPGTVTILAGSGVEGNTNGTGTAASFHFGDRRVNQDEVGEGLALDAAGNIYVGELTTASLGSQLRKITPAGVVTTVPGSEYMRITTEDDSAMPSGLVVSSTNDIWYTTGQSGFFQGVVRVNADGTSSRPAGKPSFEGLNDGTGPVAEFSRAKAIATNGTYFFVADGSNGALRRVTPGGEVITLAGVGHFNTNTFCGCGMFRAPIEGSWLMPSLFLAIPGDYYEIAAASIRMDQVGGIVVLNSGRLIYVSDHGYKCIWKITVG